MDIKELNEFYYQLQMRCNSLMLGLRHRMLETEYGWYNGHYYKNAEGEYERADYPIPVITVIEQYLDEDYYAPGMSMEDFRENMRKSQEEELGFSFQFDKDVDKDEMYGFVQLLRREEFYY